MPVSSVCPELQSLMWLNNVPSKTGGGLVCLPWHFLQVLGARANLHRGARKRCRDHGAAARLAFVRSFLCQMEKAGRVDRLSPRPRCRAVPGLGLRPSPGQGVWRAPGGEPQRGPPGRSAPFTHPRFTETALEAGTLLACRDGRSIAGPLWGRGGGGAAAVDARSLRNPGSSGVRQF